MVKNLLWTFFLSLRSALCRINVDKATYVFRSSSRCMA